MLWFTALCSLALKLTGLGFRKKFSNFCYIILSLYDKYLSKIFIKFDFGVDYLMKFQCLLVMSIQFILSLKAPKVENIHFDSKSGRGIYK